MLLIVTATETEAGPLRQLPFQPPCSVEVVGVGKLAAVLRTDELLRDASRRPDGVIITGCAGAYPGSGLTIGDVVVSSSSVLADDGA